MRQLTEKELTLLGVIGYLTQGNETIWLLLREKIIAFGFQEQVEKFQAKMLEDSNNLESNINNVLVSIATDIIEGNVDA